MAGPPLKNTANSSATLPVESDFKETGMSKFRLRDLGITIGSLPVGPLNAITDVPGVRVGHLTLIEDQRNVVRTGITVIVPREGDIGKNYAFAGFHRFNGCGEMTGIHWLEETGLLSSAIALTNTLQVGMVRDALSEYSWRYSQRGPYFLPVVAETYDGWLNDLSVSSLTHQHVFDVMQNARAGPVPEGNVGGGTGMICYDFKGGIGTSSRLVETNSGSFIIGALVQANHGDRPQLTVAGIPVGRLIDTHKVPSAWEQPPQFSSIIVILATDAPLLPMQCRRLAQRAVTGLARTGGTGHNTSGDLFLAFATGNHIPARSQGRIHLEGMLPNDQMDPLIDAAAEAVEESILNALTAADTMTGQQGRTAYALPVDDLQRLLEKI
jgi:D-aminopeptidase